MHEKRKLRLVLSVCLSFVIAIAVFILVFALQVERGWINPGVLNQIMSSNSYQYEIIDEMKEKMLQVLDSHAVDDDVLEQIWDEDKLYRAFYLYSDTILSDDKTIDSDSSDFEGMFRESLQAYLEKSGVMDFDNNYEGIVAEITNVYEHYMQPSFLIRFYQLHEKYEVKLRAAAILGALTALVGCIVLWNMYHYRHHALQYVAGGFFAAIIWNVVTTILMGRIQWISEAGVKPDCYQKLIGNFIQRETFRGYMVLALEVVLFLLLCTWMNRLRKKG